jgi:hypothetical protein
MLVIRRGKREKSWVAVSKGSCFWANQAHEVQARGVWLLAPLVEPGSPDAISPSCLHPQKRQKRPFLQSQARLMQLFLSLMMY